MMDPILRKVSARDGEEIAIRAGEAQSNDRDWLVSWHPAPAPPDGTPHGSSGICLTGDGEIVLIVLIASAGTCPVDDRKDRRRGSKPCDGSCWRKHVPRSSRRDCWGSVAAHASRAHRWVRSWSDLWRADIELAPWQPRFEVAHRRTVAAAEVIDQVAMADGLARIVSRALHEASLT